MPLQAGTSLGGYKIQSLLGLGGMGEVYCARDVKLGRDVAIKVLPSTISTDPDRVQRFAREAQLLASLNSPYIAAIYGAETHGDVTALVLELVPGQTLEEVVRRRRMEVPEALEVGRQIACALESAHERGVVHRDIKPANIKITDEGNVKVLDFGLAKALESGTMPAASVTTATFATEAGIVVGTSAYMSPEQATGRTVDRRTDIWSFGCVLYEMLAGRRAFGGRSHTEVIAAILTKDADLQQLPAATPRLSESCCSGASSATRKSACATSARRESFSDVRQIP